MPTLGFAESDPPTDDYYSGDGRYKPQRDLELGLWGVGISIVSALFMSCGLCLQKLVQKKIAEDPSKGPAYKNSMYIAGISYVGMGLIMKAVLNALLPQSTIAVLSAQTVVFTAVLEYLMLQGEMKTRTMICLAVIIGGIVLSMCGANIIDGEYSFEELRPLFVTRTSILVTTSSIAAIVAVREFLKITSSKNPEAAFSSYMGLAYLCMAGGLFAGWFGLATKTVTEIIKYAFIHGGLKRHVEQHPGLWLLLLSVPAFGVPKMKYVWYALSEFHPLQFLPLYQAVAIAANAMCGIVYYQDFSDRRAMDARVNQPLYFMGLLLVCCGVAALTFRYNANKHFASSTVESLEEGQSLLYHGDVYNTDEDFEVKGAYSGSRMGGGWPSFGGKSGLRGSATDIMIKSGIRSDDSVGVRLPSKVPGSSSSGGGGGAAFSGVAAPGNGIDDAALGGKMSPDRNGDTSSSSGTGNGRGKHHRSSSAGLAKSLGVRDGTQSQALYRGSLQGVNFGADASDDESAHQRDLL